MIPLYDASVRRRKLPVVNIALIVVNALVFIYELTLGGIDRDIFFFTFGLMPVELTQGISFQILPLRDSLGNVVEVKDIETPFHTWGTVFTSMFMHGGFMHFIGNMLFLWVFGDNVEERLGHVKYLLFYVAAGVAAAWAQIGIDLDSQTPMIGASGAISGVLGAYLMLYPYNRITTLVMFVFISVIQLPALLVLGAWFLPPAYQRTRLAGHILVRRRSGLHGPHWGIRSRHGTDGPVQTLDRRAGMGPLAPGTIIHGGCGLDGSRDLGPSVYRMWPGV